MTKREREFNLYQWLLAANELQFMMQGRVFMCAVVVLCVLGLSCLLQSGKLK